MEIRVDIDDFLIVFLCVFVVVDRFVGIAEFIGDATDAIVGQLSPE